MGYFNGIFGNRTAEATELKAPFKISICKDEFIKVKIKTLYKKMLNRCYSRSEGAKDAEKIASLFDSTEKSNAKRGLISLLASAMFNKQQISIIYDSGIVRLANSQEKDRIIKDYQKKGRSNEGVLVDFTDYCLTDLIEFYMSLLYDVLSSMNTQVGLAKSLQIKISALRGTVGLNGKDEPIQQAKDINEALLTGRSVLLDKNDQVETLKLDSTSVETSFNFICSLIASELGVSLSFVTGELTTGMSVTGEADQNADEYGFQDMFNSIFKPVCDPLYGWKLVFITDDWRYSSALLDRLIIVENSSLLSTDQKQAYANRCIPIGKTN